MANTMLITQTLPQPMVASPLFPYSSPTELFNHFLFMGLSEHGISPKCDNQESWDIKVLTHEKGHPERKKTTFWMPLLLLYKFHSTYLFYELTLN